MESRRWPLAFLLGAVILVALFPPWVRTSQDPGTSAALEPVGFHFLFIPPKPDDSYSGIHGVKVDFGRLFLEGLIIGAITAFCFLLPKRSRARTATSGVPGVSAGSVTPKAAAAPNTTESPGVADSSNAPAPSEPAPVPDPGQPGSPDTVDAPDAPASSNPDPGGPSAHAAGPTAKESPEELAFLRELNAYFDAPQPQELHHKIRGTVPETIGKRIDGIVIKVGRGPGHPLRSQLFLLFTDRTYYEFWSNGYLSLTDGVHRGGRELVLRHTGPGQETLLQIFGGEEEPSADSPLDAAAAASGVPSGASPSASAKIPSSRPAMPFPSNEWEEKELALRLSKELAMERALVGPPEILPEAANAARDLLGKRIDGIVIKSGSRPWSPFRSQIFLVFPDRTYYEFRSNGDLSGAGNIHTGDREDVLRYGAPAQSVLLQIFSEADALRANPPQGASAEVPGFSARADARKTTGAAAAVSGPPGAECERHESEPPALPRRGGVVDQSEASAATSEAEAINDLMEVASIVQSELGGVSFEEFLTALREFDFDVRVAPFAVLAYADAYEAATEEQKAAMTDPETGLEEWGDDRIRTFLSQSTLGSEPPRRKVGRSNAPRPPRSVQLDGTPDAPQKCLESLPGPVKILGFKRFAEPEQPRKTLGGPGAAGEDLKGPSAAAVAKPREVQGTPSTTDPSDDPEAIAHAFMKELFDTKGSLPFDELLDYMRELEYPPAHAPVFQTVYRNVYDEQDAAGKAKMTVPDLVAAEWPVRRIREAIAPAKGEEKKVAPSPPPSKEKEDPNQQPPRREHSPRAREALAHVDLPAIRRGLRGKQYRMLIQAHVREDPSGAVARTTLAASMAAFTDDEKRIAEPLVALFGASGLESRFWAPGPPSVTDEVLSRRFDAQRRAFWKRDAADVLDAVEVHLELRRGGAPPWADDLVFNLFKAIMLRFVVLACEQEPVREYMGIRLGLLKR